MKQRIYGYIRVSTKEQNEERQILAISKFVREENIFIDKQSGKDFKRPMYKKLIKRAKSGDLIIVTSIDRLGRNYQEIIDQWKYITQTKHINIKVLDMPLLDTTYAQDLLGTFVADLTLQVLSFVAEIERNHILDRQKEGIEAAKLRGVTFGRPEKELPLNHEEILYKWRTGTISARMCSEQLGISRSHLYRKFKKQL
ncbi:MAG: recombinase family protein [Erysipelotrichales bacterium]|nr:recombinase family protein [Erysipelotrichales bacterium]